MTTDQWETEARAIAVQNAELRERIRELEKENSDLRIYGRPAAKIVAPIIHLNGTSKERLLEALNNAWVALSVTAYDAMKETAPNGRDYYLKPGTMEQAIAQHNRRLKVIDDLAEELSQQMELINEQGA